MVGDLFYINIYERTFRNATLKNKEVSRASPNNAQSQMEYPEIPPSSGQSHKESSDNMVTDASYETVNNLNEKLSAALLKISAKEDLVKQNAKVAEEAVAGWEKSEIEALNLKKKLEAVIQENLVLQERVGHLDAALKECVQQLHQSREEQEQKIHESLVERTREWDASKSELEKRAIELEAQLKAAQMDSPAAKMKVRLEYVEQENVALKHELIICTEELEIGSIERDLSTQSAESASKQHLESIKKVARLEAECRKLRAFARKTSPGCHMTQAAVQDADNRSVSSSIFAESLCDSQSDNGDHLMGIENDLREYHGSSSKVGSLELNEKELGSSDSCASALIAELDQFKNENVNVKKNFVISGPINLSFMDDFLEMEKLAATENGGLRTTSNKKVSMLSPDGNRSPMKEELETMHLRVLELEEHVDKLTTEKHGLYTTLIECQEHLDSLNTRILEVEPRLLELQEQLSSVKEEKKIFEMEVESALEQKAKLEIQLQAANTSISSMNKDIDLLDTKLKQEKVFSDIVKTKCQDLEEALAKRSIVDEEAARTREANASYEIRMKQEKERAVAASKLAACQKTIASLGWQLKALASCDDL